MMQRSSEVFTDVCGHLATFDPFEHKRQARDEEIQFQYNWHYCASLQIEEIVYECDFVNGMFISTRYMS